MPNRGPRVNPALVGVIGAAVMFALLFFAFTNVTLFQSTITVKAQVSSGDTLAPGADAEAAGVKIGSVKSVEKGNPGALITMSIDVKKITLYRDASLQVRPHGVFGPKFVEWNPGTEATGKMADGSTVDIRNTLVSVDFEQVLNALDENTRTSLKTFFYEFGTASENRGADFGDFIQKFQVVSEQLTPPLLVIDNRSATVGRLFEDNAVVTETYANSPIDQIIDYNNTFLGTLDNHRDDVVGVVTHGDNVLGDVAIVTGGNNVQNLRTVLQKVTGLQDQLQRLSNLLGFGVNSLNPAVMPSHGQSMGDIELAVRRSVDAFGQCDVVDPGGPNGSGGTAPADTLHANFIKIAPCSAPGAHHHVSVLLGLHTNPGVPLAGTVGTVCGLAGLTGLPKTLCDALLGTSITCPVGPGGPPPVTLFDCLQRLVGATPAAEDQGGTLCGPNTSNASRLALGTPAFSCNTTIESKAIPPFDGPPPPLFGCASGFAWNCPGFGAGAGSGTPTSGPALLMGQSRATFNDRVSGHRATGEP